MTNCIGGHLEASLNYYFHDMTLLMTMSWHKRSAVISGARFIFLHRDRVKWSWVILVNHSVLTSYSDTPQKCAKDAVFLKIG
jgi:hypothetical protein